MRLRRHQCGHWTILAIAIGIALAVGVRAALRLRAPSDLMSSVGNGLVVLLSALVLVLLGVAFLVAWLSGHATDHKAPRGERTGDRDVTD